MRAACQRQKGINDILIICQLYSFVMGEQDVLNRFVLQAVDILLSGAFCSVIHLMKGWDLKYTCSILCTI